MAEVNVFIDGVNLADATAVYTDSSLTTLAADAYYSDLSITRQQLNGKLGSIITCPSCSGSPATPTTSTVTQTVTNNISGGTLGVDYTLSGSGYDGGAPPGPVTQSQVTDYPFDFTITATPAAGKEFDSDAPFTATNPAGSIPDGGGTVNNTLTGTIITSPSTVAGQYYLLQACLTGAQASAGGLEGPGNAYIYLSAAPANGQRYVTTNTRLPEFYYFLPSSAPLDTLANRTEPEFKPSSSAPTPGNLQVDEIPGESFCPKAQTNLTKEFIYELRNCNTNSIGQYFKSPTQQEISTRVVDDAGDTFIIEQLLLEGQEVGLTEKQGVLLVDIDGVTSSSTNFTGAVQGCPPQNVLLRFCGSVPGTSLLGLSLAVAKQAPNDPIFTNGLLGEVYLDSEGACWVVQLLTESGNQIGKGIPPRNLKQHISGGCQACTSGGSYS